MKKQNKKSIVASRRGFSLTEVVVGMTVILIVSAATLTTILSHMNFEKTIVQTIEATNIVENAIECFDAGGRSNFENYYFKNIYGENYESELSLEDNGDADAGLISEADEYEYEYKYMDVTIKVSDTTITITVKSSETGKSLLRSEEPVTYTIQ